jgi:hypothetical protein
MGRRTPGRWATDPFSRLAGAVARPRGLAGRVDPRGGGATGSSASGFTDAGGENCIRGPSHGDLPRLRPPTCGRGGGVLRRHGWAGAVFFFPRIGDVPILGRPFAIASDGGAGDPAHNPCPCAPFGPRYHRSTSIIVCNASWPPPWRAGCSFRRRRKRLVRPGPGAAARPGPGARRDHAGRGEGAAAWRRGDAALRRPAVRWRWSTRWGRATPRSRPRPSRSRSSMEAVLERRARHGLGLRRGSSAPARVSYGRLQTRAEGCVAASAPAAWPAMPCLISIGLIFGLGRERSTGYHSR